MLFLFGYGVEFTFSRKKMWVMTLEYDTVPVVIINFLLLYGVLCFLGVPVISQGYVAYLTHLAIPKVWGRPSCEPDIISQRLTLWLSIPSTKDFRKSNEIGRLFNR